MVNIKSETIRLTEDTKFLKEETNKFWSSLVEKYNNISSIAASFEYQLGKMTVSNIVGRKIKSDKS